MSQIIQKNVRKADMTAQNQYDWSRLVFSRKEFLESTYEESKEEILFSYETEGTQNFKEIKSEKREEILIALMDWLNYRRFVNIIKYSFTLKIFTMIFIVM